MVKRNRPLFSWSEVERLPELERLEWVLKALPDEELLSALEQRRGRGRDDYSIRAMWRALIAGIVFQHVSVESLLRELRRNPAPVGRVRVRSDGTAKAAEADRGVGAEGGAARGGSAIEVELLPVSEFGGEAGGGRGTDCGDDGEAAGAVDGGGGELRGALGV